LQKLDDNLDLHDEINAVKVQLEAEYKKHKWLMESEERDKAAQNEVMTPEKLEEAKKLREAAYKSYHDYKQQMLNALKSAYLQQQQNWKITKRPEGQQRFRI
jgi:hypothetical protein